MSIKVELLPALTDNYIPIIIGANRSCYVVDPAEAKSVLQFTQAQNLNIEGILNTHHHYDHVGGILEIAANSKCKVYGPSYDIHRTPGIQQPLQDGDTIEVLGEPVTVKYVPGHTLGHIAYYFENSGILFIGDTLFAMGCGRLFEGTPEQMYDSLSWVKSLPGDTLVYCAHEYTLNNSDFALQVEPSNQRLQERRQHVMKARELGQSTVPTKLTSKNKPILFYGVILWKLNSSLELPNDADEFTVFAKLRQFKDEF
ncbi:MAG: hydroxyacylglutathione hydrolase [Bdellovibrionales bacterium]